MAASGAHRVAVPEEMAPPSRRDDASAFEVPIGGRRFLTPEQWARATFEGAPPLLGALVAFGWRFVLGLRLQPKSSPHSVAGWPIAHSGADALTIEAEARWLRARNTVVVRDATVMVVTEVHFEGALGRLLWTAAAPIHHRVIPYLLGRARG